MAYVVSDGVTNRVNSWNFRDQHVEQFLTSDEFCSAASTLICAGPPRLSQLAGGLGDAAAALQKAGLDESVDATKLFGIAFPIGVVVNAGIQQNKQLQRVFEIGSMRSYMIPGRVMGGLSINRIYYHGPSLMKALYFWRVNKAGSVVGGSTRGPNQSGADSKLLEDIATAGQDNFMLNLSSNLFNRPVGLLIMFKDSGNSNIAACYIEDCYIQSHSFSVTADAVILSEQVQIQFDRIVPVKIAGDAGTSVERQMLSPEKAASEGGSVNDIDFGTPFKKA